MAATGTSQRSLSSRLPYPNVDKSRNSQIALAVVIFIAAMCKGVHQTKANVPETIVVA